MAMKQNVPHSYSLHITSRTEFRILSGDSSQTIELAAPAAPTGLTAVSTSPTSVLLDWTAPTPANGVVSYYTVQVQVYNSTLGYAYVSAVNTSTNTTSVNVTGLSACTTYAFAVSGTTACGSDSGCTGPYSSALANISTPANSTLVFAKRKSLSVFTRNSRPVFSSSQAAHLIISNELVVVFTIEKIVHIALHCFGFVFARQRRQR